MPGRTTAVQRENSENISASHRPRTHQGLHVAHLLPSLTPNKRKELSLFDLQSGDTSSVTPHYSAKKSEEASLYPLFQELLSPQIAPSLHSLAGASVKTESPSIATTFDRLIAQARKEEQLELHGLKKATMELLAKAEDVKGKKEMAVLQRETSSPQEEVDLQGLEMAVTALMARAEKALSEEEKSAIIRAANELFSKCFSAFTTILRQAEHNAKKIYDSIDGRTKDVQHLIMLDGKINQTKGAIDWSNDTAMKDALDRARKIGVQIEEGKYTFTEEEKKLLKENIQTFQTQLDKTTQLERVDLQGAFQQISQCIQLLSNTLTILINLSRTLNRNTAPH